MPSEVKVLPKSEILITIEVDPKTLEGYEAAATRAISQQIDVPGFRKGQAPKAFVIAQIGADAFFQRVLDIALPRSYFEAVKEKNLQVISRPDIKLLSKSPLKYEARVAVLPEITIKGIEKIKIPKQEISVSDKEIDEVIAEMRKYRATFKPLDREIRKGDRIEIDFQGYDEGGAALDKTKSANHPLFVGEGSLVPGFEEELVGMKAGERKKFPLTFPKDFHYEPLKSKLVHFEVEIKRAEETILPEITDEFVEKLLGEKKSVFDFQTILKADLAKRKEIEHRSSRENSLLEKFLEESKFDVPPILIEEEIDYMIEDLKREIESRGLKFEPYMEKMKKENRDIRKEYSAEAEKRVRIRLILNFLFRKFEITINDEETQKAYDKLIERTPEKDRADLQKEFVKGTPLTLRIKNNLMLEKLFTRFLD